MRSAGNFSPEWGYLAPAPSMLRTVRVVLVATAVGATAGAGVVLSLVDRSSDGDKVVAAAHAIVTSAQAAPAQEQPVVSAASIAVPVAAAAPAMSEVKVAPANLTTPAVAAAPNTIQSPPQIQAAAPIPAQPDNGTQAAAAATAQQPAGVQSATTNDASAATASPALPAVAALSDSSVAAVTPDAPAVASDATGGDQAIVGPQQPAAQQKKAKHHRGTANNHDFIGNALRHLFSARAGASYYSNRGL
jgi:hypothetical protein